MATMRLHAVSRDEHADRRRLIIFLLIRYDFSAARMWKDRRIDIPILILSDCFFVHKVLWHVAFALLPFIINYLSESKSSD
jgi:hypothetical protein